MQLFKLQLAFWQLRMNSLKFAYMIWKGKPACNVMEGVQQCSPVFVHKVATLVGTHHGSSMRPCHLQCG